MEYDVLISGAGPAGSALAIHLGRVGRTVALFDRAVFPREKACGEGILPAGVAALRRLGISPEGHAFQGVRYHHEGKSVAGEFPGGSGRSVRRAVLDALLVESASREKNVKVFTGQPVETPIVAGGVVRGVLTAEREYRAPLVVAADGVNSLLRTRLGWGVARRTGRYGVRRHYRSVEPLAPWVDAYLEADGETYVTPLPGAELGVAQLGSPTATLPPELGAIEPIDAPLGASPLTVRPLRRYGPGCLLLGDAAGNCDPIIGAGITQALLSAELLASHLARRFPLDLMDLKAFDRERQRLVAPQRYLAAGVLSLAARPRLIRPMFAALEHIPGLFSGLLGVAGGRA